MKLTEAHEMRESSSDATTPTHGTPMDTDQRFKALEAQLDTLQHAHRALSAQHTALMETFKLIGRDLLPDATRLARLTVLHDTVSALMEEHGQDADYQAEVLHWLDVLAGALVGASNTPPRRNRGG